MGNALSQIISLMHESNTIVTGNDMDSDDKITGPIDSLKDGRVYVNGFEVCRNSVIKNYLNS